MENSGKKSILRLFDINNKQISLPRLDISNNKNIPSPDYKLNSNEFSTVNKSGKKKQSIVDVMINDIKVKLIAAKFKKKYNGNTNSELISPRRKRNNQILLKHVVDLRVPEDCEMVIDILNRQDKNKAEQQFLKKALYGLSLFQNHQELLDKQDVSSYLFNEFDHEIFIKNQIIFKFGQTGHKYYVVLQGFQLKLSKQLFSLFSKGAVLLIRPKMQEVKELYNNYNHQDINAIEEENLEQKNKIQNANKNNGIFNFKGIFKDSSNELEEDLDGSIFMSKYFPNQELIKICRSGEAFGEIALITKAFRTATAVCKTTTHLMTLSDVGFNEILGTYNKQVMIDNLLFLQKIPIFANVPEEILLSVVQDLKKMEFRKQSYIYKKKDQVDYLYFILSGEVQLERQISFQEELKKQGKLHNKGDYLNYSETQRDNRQLHKLIPFTIRGQGSYFGEEEILFLKKQRETAASCLSANAQIFVLPIKILQTTLKAFNCIELISQEFNQKKQWVDQREDNIYRNNPNSQQHSFHKSENFIQTQRSSFITKYFNPKPIEQNNALDPRLQKRQEITESIQQLSSQQIATSRLENKPQVQHKYQLSENFEQRQWLGINQKDTTTSNNLEIPIIQPELKRVKKNRRVNTQIDYPQLFVTPLQQKYDSVLTNQKNHSIKQLSHNFLGQQIRVMNKKKINILKERLKGCNSEQKKLSQFTIFSEDQPPSMTQMKRATAAVISNNINVKNQNLAIQEEILKLSSRQRIETNYQIKDKDSETIHPQLKENGYKLRELIEKIVQQKREQFIKTKSISQDYVNNQNKLNDDLYQYYYPENNINNKFIININGSQTKRQQNNEQNYKVQRQNQQTQMPQSFTASTSQLIQ